HRLLLPRPLHVHVPGGRRPHAEALRADFRGLEGRWWRAGVLGCCPARDLSRRKPMTTKSMARLAVLLAFGAVFALPAGAAAQEVIRIGCPTKTYFPTILATVTQEQGLFDKEGLRPEVT